MDEMKRFNMHGQGIRWDKFRAVVFIETDPDNIDDREDVASKEFIAETMDLLKGQVEKFLSSYGLNLSKVEKYDDGCYSCYGTAGYLGQVRFFDMTPTDM